MINLINLVLRAKPYQIAVVKTEETQDHEIYAKTRIEWKEKSKSLLSQLPTLLSYLEAGRATMSTPSEINLESDEGMVVYIPTGLRISSMPETPKHAVSFLTKIAQDALEHYYTTAKIVEQVFWKAAMQKFLSPDIVERIAREETGYGSSHRRRFHELMRQYFSVKFTVHTAENVLRVEA